MTPEREQTVIRRVQSGDAEAFALLVEAYQKTIYNLCLRMTGNRADAEDLSQEVFLTAYRRLGDFRGEGRFSVWLCRIASNACIDFLRRSRRQETLSLTRDEDDEEQAEWAVADESLSPERLLEQRMTREALRRGLTALEPEQRQILLLRELEGLRYDEIAQALAIGEGTVKSRLFRARKKLCAFLLRDGNLPDAFSSETVKGGMRP